MNFFRILDQLAEADSDLLARLNSRRTVLSGLSKSAMLATPALLGAVFQQAYAGTTGIKSTAVDILNYALTLELLEENFYVQFLAAGLIPAGAPLAAITKIKNHETQHVALLTSVIRNLGSTPVTGVRFKASALPGTYAGQLSVAQQLEDTGVRAYKGRAGELVAVADTVVPSVGTINLLTVALQIHSMEARHAAHIRTMRGQTPWVTPNDDLLANAATATPYTAGLSAGTTPSTTQTLGGTSFGIPAYITPSVAESNTLVAGFDVKTSLSGPTTVAAYEAVDAAAAFDEVLQPAEVFDPSRAGGLIA